MKKSDAQAQILELREKLFDIELSINKIKSLNNLLSYYSNENSPEGFIISEQISKQIDEIDSIL